MSTQAQARDPKGIPTGGRFAATARTEAGTALAGGSHPPIVQRHTRGEFTVVETGMRDVPSGTPGVLRTVIQIGGFPEVSAQTGTAALRMERSEQVDAITGRLAQLAEGSSKASVLYRTRSGDVIAKEGTLTVRDGEIVMWDKGTGKTGQWMTGASSAKQILAVAPGYGGSQGLADRFWALAASVPELEPATFDGIPEWDGDGEPPTDIAAVYVFNHPGFDGTQDGRGSVFFATDVQGEDGIVNGYGVYSPTSGLTSEHGSMYTADLKRWGGRVSGYQPGSHTWSDVRGLARAADAYGDGDIEQVWQSVTDACR